jgi:hypothetical protein
MTLTSDVPLVSGPSGGKERAGDPGRRERFQCSLSRRRSANLAA